MQVPFATGNPNCTIQTSVSCSSRERAIYGDCWPRLLEDPFLFTRQPLTINHLMTCTPERAAEATVDSRCGRGLHATLASGPGFAEPRQASRVNIVDVLSNAQQRARPAAARSTLASAVRAPPFQPSSTLSNMWFALRSRHPTARAIFCALMRASRPATVLAAHGRDKEVFWKAFLPAAWARRRAVAGR